MGTLNGVCRFGFATVLGPFGAEGGTGGHHNLQHCWESWYREIRGAKALLASNTRQVAAVSSGCRAGAGRHSGFPTKESYCWNLFKICCLDQSSSNSLRKACATSVLVYCSWAFPGEGKKKISNFRTARFPSLCAHLFLWQLKPEGVNMPHKTAAGIKTA